MKSGSEIEKYAMKEVIDDVVAWFPIPSFDETLEVNKDVLERIKEKED